MEQGVGLIETGSQTKEFEGYRVTFTAPKIIKAKDKVRFIYSLEKDGKPLHDLEPYLAAAMHIGIVREDLGVFSHTHGEAYQFGSIWFQQQMGKYIKYHIHFAPDAFGSAVIAQPRLSVFPTAGRYQVFGEFKHNGKVIVTYFTVDVESSLGFIPRSSAALLFCHPRPDRGSRSSGLDSCFRRNDRRGIDTP